MNTSASTQKKSLFSHKLLKIIPAIFISIYLIIWGISSPLSKYFIEPLLQEQGLTLSSEASIYYNPFLSQLTISDFSLYSNNANEAEKVLSLNKLTVRLTLYRLFFDEVVVSEFELNDVYLKVVKTPSQLIIAGIDLNKESDAAPEEETPETVSEPLPYQLILPRLSLNKVNIDINNNEIPHQIDINELLISEIKASLESQTARVSLQSAIDGTALEIVADAVFDNGQGEVNSQLSINDYPIQKIQPYVTELSELSGFLSFTSQQKVTIASDIVTLHVNKAELSNKDLLVGYQEQFFNLKYFKTSIDDLLLTLNGDKITELSGMSQLTLNDAEVHYEKTSQKLAYIKQLALQDISFYLTDGEPQVKIANLIVDEIYGSKNEETTYPPIVALKQFSVKDVFANAKQLSIDTIILDSLQSNLILNEESTIANLVSLPISKTEEDEVREEVIAVEVETSTQETPFIISLNEFSLISDNQLTLIDNSVEPMMQSRVVIDTLTLGALSNAANKQEEQTPFELKGRINKYAHFDFKGFTLPFSQIQKHHLEGSLQELSLPAVSRYMKKAVNMELKSGQLNTDIQVTLTGEELNGKVLILLRSLETAVAGSDEAGSLIDQGALPFNMALGMLKDGHGDVELDVALSGSTSDPSFGMGSIVTLITQKAIWMATKEYVMTTFVPYANVVSVAMSVGEFALKLRFDDLIYQTKQIEPNEAQQAYLQGFIALMQDKEKTRVNICGISVPADINLNAGTKVTDIKHINQLKEIAEQREATFKDYIIEHGGIASSRLLLCAPKIDSSESALPRIELSV
jgi:hypothetical protein